MPTTAAAAPLTLDDALRRAIDADPARAAAEARIEAARSGVRQADRSPNPSLNLVGENFAGNGPYSSFGRSETTLSYQQLIELGGKRGARTDVARTEVDAARLRRDVLLLDLCREVERAWVEAVAAEAMVGIARERHEVALRLKADVARRTQAGRDPTFADARATAQTAQTQIAVDQARSAAARARATLSAYWQGAPDFEVDPKWLEDVTRDDGTTGTTADSDLLEAEKQAAAARQRLEEARAVQDPTFHLGVRRFADGNDLALVGGISIPLAINDANRGNIARAQAERSAAERDLIALQRMRARATAEVRSRLMDEAAEVARLDREVIPEARRAVRLAFEGFNRGSFTFTDAFETQRALNDVLARRIDTLRTFHLDKAELDRLTGRRSNLIGAEGAGQ